MKDKFIERKDTTLLHTFHPQPSPPLPLQKRECFSNESESLNTEQTKKPKPSNEETKQHHQLAIVPHIGDGSSVEVSKRPRGRPPGSKNKPKSPMVISRDSEPSSAMRPHVLEIPNGQDIIDSLSRFSRRRNLGISVLSGTGAVSNVTLRQPTGTSGSIGTIGFQGRFEILSISATFLPPAMSALAPGAMNGTNISISLAGPHGQILGGTTVGPIVANGTVVIVAAAFTNPTFHKLPAEDDMSVSVSVSGGGEADEHEHAHHGNDHDGHGHHHVQHRQYEEEKVNMYSCHMPSDVIWAPTARPPY
ncbi:hypothetical protein LUZ60_002674 [Juncus effusus]|nr:hypothetical protein LUZ60_002674 [Juncus effusus]